MLFLQVYTSCTQDFRRIQENWRAYKQKKSFRRVLCLIVWWCICIHQRRGDEEGYVNVCPAAAPRIGNIILWKRENFDRLCRNSGCFNGFEKRNSHRILDICHADKLCISFLFFFFFLFLFFCFPSFSIQKRKQNLYIYFSIVFSLSLVPSSSTYGLKTRKSRNNISP